jgi:hypothetical protein
LEVTIVAAANLFLVPKTGFPRRRIVGNPNMAEQAGYNPDSDKRQNFTLRFAVNSLHP